MIEYNKLIRDRIPEIIKASGKECLIEIMSEEEYINALEIKLNEELVEYQEEKDLEELADLLEVIYAITVARGHTIQELEQLRNKKLIERGGFIKRLHLKWVSSK